MTRLTFYEPASELSAEDLHNVLLVAGVNVPQAVIVDWTKIERIVAYDWAMREHLRASDNLVRRRECPYFVRSADTGMTP